jgi:ABC-type bacteriocin/lantibiotic exporter with double-glycine peptidase domain
VREQQETEAPKVDTSGGAASSLARDLTLYTIARFGMVAIVTLLLMLAKVPALVALAVSVVVMMPLSLLVFRRLRRRVAAGLAERNAERSARRAQLRAQLRGEQAPDAG